MKGRFSKVAMHSILICFTLSTYDLAVASSPPSGENGIHFCGVMEQRTDNRRYARSLANLNTGEPRTVRMIYFLPNDRPYRADVVNRMKNEIRSIQTFYAEQMEAHRYGKVTFHVETDAQGEPIVHRVNGRHPDSHYLDNTFGSVLDEIEETFDLNSNIYLTVIDNSANLIIDVSEDMHGGGRASRIQKSGGFALVSAGFGFNVAAHELGHTFGLNHDFRSRAYLMSYGGSSQPRLSACNAEFLAAHPYFNPAVPVEVGSEPIIDILSSPKYPPGASSVSIHLNIRDAEGLHQVFLLGEPRLPGVEVLECRGLAGVEDAEINFDYDGYSPDRADWGEIRRLSDQNAYPIEVLVVDIAGNISTTFFELSEEVASEVPRASIIEIIAGADQQGTPHSILPNPLVVVVKDQYGQPVPEELVQFLVVEGDARFNGKFSLMNAMTDTLGRASQTLTLGPHAETNIIRVSTPDVPECEPVIFSVIVIGIPPISVMDGDSQTWSLPVGATARLGKGLINDETDRTVSFSPDGQHVAAASGIGIWLYDVATLRESALLRHRSPVLSVTFSRDGSMLASGLKDGKIFLWDVATRRNIGSLEGHNGLVSSVSFSSDGSKLVSGDYWQTVKLWEVATMRNIATWSVNLVDQRLAPISVALSPDGTMLVSGFLDGTLRLWNEATKENFSYLEGHRLHVRSVTFSPDGEMIASGSEDGNVKLWDAKSKQNIATLRAHSGAVTSVVFSLDGSTVASGSRDRTVQLWDVATKDHFASLVGGHTSWITSVSLSPDGKVLASTSVDGAIALWNLETRNATTISGVGHVDIGASVSFSPSEEILVSAAEDGVLKLWDVETGQISKSFGLRPYGIDVVSFSPDGTTVAAGSLDNTIDLWNVPTSTKIASFKRGKGQILSLAFPRNGMTLAAGDPDGVVLWDVATGTYISTPLGHSSWVWAIAYSPDGTTVVSGEGDWNGKVTLWDTATLTRTATLDHTSWVWSLTFSRNGETLAAGFGDGVVALWDMATLSRIATLHHTNAVHSVAFSLDGRIIASGTGGGMILLWDVGTEEMIATLEGHTDSVKSLSLSPDGSRLASGSADGTILIWDLQAPRLRPLDLVEISGNNQQSLPGVALENPFVVELRDQSGNPLQGVQVMFSVTSGGGTLSATIVTTDSNGRAESTLTLGPEPGTNTVTVSVTGIQDEQTFTAEGMRIPKTFAIISGNDQEGPPGTALETAFVVEVSDQFNTPFAGAQVTFSVSGGGGTLSATSVTTDSDGRAQSILTLGPHPGTNTVEVEVTDIQEKQTVSAIAELPRIPQDVNGDNVVNILDLVLVASVLGTVGPDLVADVNGDGTVNILDLVSVAGALGKTAAAPSSNAQALRMIAAADVQQWLSQARQHNLTDAISQQGIRFLDQLLAALIPEETTLLPNYPNPFNPETWIPYQLAKPSDVTLTIYAANGQMVRQFSLGHQLAGNYYNKNRAVYWDGRASFGETVASGVYYYHLSAGEYSAARRMLIIK